MKKPAPKIARHRPWYFKVVAGKRYQWCACGRSASQPFCDGSHQGTGIQPLSWQAGDSDHEVLFCGCKHSKNPPLCDGSHNNLRQHYASDDPRSEANRQIAEARHRRYGNIELNGRCFITSPDHKPMRCTDSLEWTVLVDEGSGAHFQSQFFLSLDSGISPRMTCGGSHAVILCVDGHGEVEIGGRGFKLAPLTGVSVLPGETIRLRSGSRLKMLLSACPMIDAPRFEPNETEPFDDRHPDRCRRYEPDRTMAMGDRAYQVLVDASLGSPQVTQFIGLIPPSKAAMHRHLYEECLAIISGQGWLWTEDLKARVGAGDLVFLPARQPHSLQVTDPAGMIVAGVIYPGGNPDINY